MDHMVTTDTHQFEPTNEIITYSSKVVGKMATIQLSQLDVSKTPHAVAMIESDGTTENGAFDYNETTNPLPTDACGQQPCLAYKIFTTSFQDAPLNCTLKIPTLIRSGSNYLQGQYLCTLSPSRYSLRRWLEAYISLKQKTAWHMWRYWNGIIHCNNLNAVPAICMMIGTNAQARMSPISPSSNG